MMKIMIRGAVQPVSFGGLIAASLLNFACTPREDPGVTEKIALIEAELRDRDEQLAALQETEESAPAAAAAPDLDAARNAYLTFVENLRSKLSEAMPAAKFERPSVYPVEGPDPSRPIVSRVSFRIIGEDGRAGEMAIPLFADAAGQWQDPAVEEIVSKFASKQAAPPVVASAPAAPPPPPAPAKPTDVMGADRTVEVQWNDAPKPQPTQRPAPAPAAPVPAPAPALPKKVMPTTRDVIIDFE